MARQNDYPDMSRLITLLESLANNTYQAKVNIESNCDLVSSLLTGWTISESKSPQSENICHCSENEKHHYHSLVDKVEKAVKYSQSVREGRDDVQSPWEVCVDEAEITRGNSKVILKKVTSKTDLMPPVPPKKTFAVRNKPALESITNPRKSNSMPVKVESEKKKSCEDSFTCPIHGSSKLDEKNVEPIPPTVGLAEALDVKGIPPELVTILKTFHRYLERLRTTRLKNKAEAGFLKRFNHSCNGKQSKLSPLFDEFAKAFPPSVSRGKLPLMKDKDDNENQADPSVNLTSVGIWNLDIVDVIQDNSLCVHYQDGNAWQSLQSRLQQLQRSQAELQVLNILISDVIRPLVGHRSLDQTAPLYLKAAIALSRFTSLNFPAVVRPKKTDATQ